MDYEGGGEDADLDAGHEDLFFLKAVGGVRFMSDVYFSFSLCFPCFIFLSAVLPLLFIFFFLILLYPSLFSPNTLSVVLFSLAFLPLLFFLTPFLPYSLYNPLVCYSSMYNQEIP